MNDSRDASDPSQPYEPMPREDIRPLEVVQNGTEPLLPNSDSSSTNKASEPIRYNGIGDGHHSEESRTSSDTSIDSLDMQREDPLEDDEETGLTQGDREGRARRKKRNSSLGARVAGQEVGAEEIETISKKTFFQRVGINVTLILLWYIFSICISVYNKWMFAPENLDFHFPMFTTSCHMLMQFLLSSLVLLIFPRFRPKRQKIEDDSGQTDGSAAPEIKPVRYKPIMTPWFYLTRIVSCGTVTGLDIGLGNTSLKYISLTFFTMCKSSTLGFVLAFAILFRLEKPSWKIGAIIAVMTVGVIMMVAGETAFDTLGFVLLMMASLCSGLRWSLTQILLRRTPATSNPFATLFFLTPVMFIILFILAIPMEGLGAVGEGVRIVAAKHGYWFGIGILLFPGVLAFLMVSSEFALLQRTSVVTLSVCGIFKEVLTISAAAIIFNDELTPINISGLCVSLAAIAAYNYIRMKKMRKKVTKKTRKEAEEHVVEESAEPLNEEIPQEDLEETTAMIRHVESPTGISKQLPEQSSQSALAKRRPDSP